MSIFPSEPLQRYRLALFVALVVACVALDLAVCVALSTIVSSVVRLAVGWFVVIIGACLYREIEAGDDESIADRSGMMLVGVVFACVLAGTEIHPEAAVLKGVAGLFLFVGCCAAANTAQGIVATRLLIALWVVSGVGLTAAHAFHLALARELFEISATRHYADVRLILTGAVAAYIASVGIVRGLAEPLPETPPLGIRPIPLAEDAGGIIGAFLIPVAAVLHFMSKAVIWFIDTVWSFVFGVGMYMSRATRHAGKAFVDAVSDWKLLDAVKDLLLVAAAAVILGRVGPSVADTAISYLRESSASVVPDSSAIVLLARLTGYFVASFLTIVAMRAAVDLQFDDEVTRRAIVNMTGALLAFGIAGACMYLARYASAYAFVGFERIGAFSEAMLVLFVLLTLRHVGQLRRHSVRSKAP